MPYPTGDRVTDTIIKSLIDRQAEGQRKYGVTLAENAAYDEPFKWLTELQEELLDAIQYIEKFKLEQENLCEQVLALINPDLDYGDLVADEIYNLFHPAPPTMVE